MMLVLDIHLAGSGRIILAFFTLQARYGSSELFSSLVCIELIPPF
jgi:hypothetical protein